MRGSASDFVDGKKVVKIFIHPIDPCVDLSQSSEKATQRAMYGINKFSVQTIFNNMFRFVTVSYRHNCVFYVVRGRARVIGDGWAGSIWRNHRPSPFLGFSPRLKRQFFRSSLPVGRRPRTPCLPFCHLPTPSFFALPLRVDAPRVRCCASPPAREFGRVHTSGGPGGFAVVRTAQARGIHGHRRTGGASGRGASDRASALACGQVGLARGRTVLAVGFPVLRVVDFPVGRPRAASCNWGVGFVLAQNSNSREF